MKAITAERAKANQVAAGGDRSLFLNSGKAINPVNTTLEVAKSAGVSKDTVIKARKVTADAPPSVSP